ncbi:MAG: tRNA (pseudouridine(54)-N(1))-methyltransferase TrmY, partial [Candidatus Thermoplasmatota archaeon]|nr:tRNA (pseudouridine(54)-N(1))-methyltransferase TrmY [Candidatus Thermoplasmatota archaeon]
MAADRNFVILGHRAHTAPDWKLDDLCGGAGRLDVLVRCVTAAMWISHGLRRDTDVWLLLQGPPAPPVAVHFCGAT